MNFTRSWPCGDKELRDDLELDKNQPKHQLFKICLHCQKYAYEGWADTMVSGWGGINSTDSTESNTLKYVKVPMVSDAACAATEPEYGFYPDTMNCAGKFITQCTLHFLCGSYFYVTRAGCWQQGCVLWRYRRSFGHQSPRGGRWLLTRWDYQLRL